MSLLVIPPEGGDKTSSSGAGEQTADFTLADGVYLLHAASIDTDNKMAEACSINYVYLTGDGSERELCLASGYVANNSPFCLPKAFLILGRGYIRAKVYMLDSDTFNFKAEWTKITGISSQEFDIGRLLFSGVVG